MNERPNVGTGEHHEVAYLLIVVCWLPNRLSAKSRCRTSFMPADAPAFELAAEPSLPEARAPLSRHPINTFTCSAAFASMPPPAKSFITIQSSDPRLVLAAVAARGPGTVFRWPLRAAATKSANAFLAGGSHNAHSRSYYDDSVLQHRRRCRIRPGPPARTIEAPDPTTHSSRL